MVKIKITYWTKGTYENPSERISLTVRVDVVPRIGEYLRIEGKHSYTRLEVEGVEHSVSKNTIEVSANYLGETQKTD